MKILKAIKSSFVPISFLLFNLHHATAFAQGTAFSYQGKLNDGGTPVNGSYDISFTLFTNNANGVAVAGPVTNSAVTVTNGLFTTLVDFGSVFTGTSSWLQIAVSTNAANNFSTLAPRQQVTPVPYAITAENVLGGGLAAGTYANAVTLSNAANQFSGTFSGNGASVTGVDANTLDGLGAGSFWLLGGNTATTPGTQFIGTTDNKALTIKVNSVTALQVVPGTTLPNLLGGLAGTHPSVIASGVSGAVIAGGNAPSGAVSGNGGGDFQAVYDNDGTVGGGFGNKVGSNNGDLTDAAFATVAGGVFNAATNYAATVGGGDGNTSGGSRSFVGGGYGNTTTAHFSFMGGGLVNTIRSATNAVIVGGYNNYVGPLAFGAVIGGGSLNTNLGAYAVVCGGWSNNASGYLSFIGGGGNDGAGDLGNVASGEAASIVGGQQNIASGFWGSIGGGGGNTASGTGTVVGGGLDNAASLDFAVVSGGIFNTASGVGAFVGGGGADSVDGYPGNVASGDFSVVDGGSGNTAGSGYGATVGGGITNTAFGVAATVPGGANNTASGNFSLAAGYHANALHDGTFVWADSQNSPFASTGNNQFLIRASGGVGIGTGNPQGSLHVYSDNNPTVVRIQSSGTPGFGRIEFVSNPQTDVNQWRPGYIQSLDEGGFTGGLGFYVNGTGSGNKFGTNEVMRIVNGAIGINTNNPQSALHVNGEVRWGPANLLSTNQSGSIELGNSTQAGVIPFIDFHYGTGSAQDYNIRIINDGDQQFTIFRSGSSVPLARLNAGGLTVNGVLASTSDRNLKENFLTVNPQEVLKQVAALPVSRWNYKDDKSSEHIGPMAQDFYAAFHVGADDKHITTVDEGGVALAAIQGLNQKLETENAELKHANAALEKRLEALEQIILNQKSN